MPEASYIPGVLLHSHHPHPLIPPLIGHLYGDPPVFAGLAMPCGVVAVVAGAAAARGVAGTGHGLPSVNGDDVGAGRSHLGYDR